MFEIRSPTPRVLLNFTLNGILKWLEISNIVSKESFELVLVNQDNIVHILLLFILLPAKVDIVLEKRHNKKILVKAFNSGGGKIVLKLLTAVVIFHVRFTIIHVWGLGFQKFCNNVTLGAESSRSGSHVTTIKHNFTSSGLTSISALSSSSSTLLSRRRSVPPHQSQG